MKKFPLVLSLPILATSMMVLSGCSSSEKIDLMYGDANATTVESISYEVLKEKVDSKETFLLVVQYSDGCACWAREAKPTLEKYIEEKHVVVYHIKLEQLDAGGSRFDMTIVTGNVTFAIFEEGVVKHCVTTQDNETLKKIDAFKSYFEELVNLPRIYYVTIDNVDKMYRADETNIIYFYRKTCGDCSYLNTHYLKTWSKEHPNYKKNIYILDCDVPDIRYDDEGNYNEEQWFTFKHDYGLSTKNNPDYGFDGGYVPTFLLVKGSTAGPTYLSASVTFNDSVEEINGQYVVTNTYYSEARLPKLEYIDDSVETKVLEKMVLTSEDVTVYPEYGNYISWNHGSAEKYHNVFTEKFLDYCESK